MKTTNILLALIALLLFLNLIKGSSISFFSEANAQDFKQAKINKEEVVNVRIVSVESSAIFNVSPKNDITRTGYALPVFITNGHLVDYREPVLVHQVNK